MKNLILAIFILFSFSCKHESNSNILNHTDQLIIENPDKALQLLDSLSFSDNLSEKEKMHYVWNKAKVHYKLGQPLAEDTLLPKAITYYRKLADTTKLLDGYLLMASFQNSLGKTNHAVATLDSGYRKAVKSGNISTMISFLNDEATYYFHQHDYASTIHKLNELLRLSDSIPLKQRYKSTYMLAFILSLSSNPSYEEYYRQSINMAFAAKDTASACEIMRNFAGSLSGDQQYHHSNQQLFAIGRYMPNMEKLSAIQMLMAENYINMHKLDSARICFKAAFKSENELISAGYPDIARKSGIEMLKYLLDYSSGKPISISSFCRYCDSISNDIRMRKDIELKQVEEKQRLQTVNSGLRLESQRMWWSLVSLILILSIAGIGIYLYIRNRYYRLAEAENRVDTLTRLVEDAKRSTTDTPQLEDNVFFKKILMNQLGIIKLVAGTPTNQNQALLRRISAISEGDIPVDELLSWPDLYPIIDSLYDNFHSRLMEEYGDVLKDKEIKICCLLCAGFSTKEIGVVTQQSDATIYVRKSSIRKKLRIDEKQDIVDFIKRH